MLIGKEFKQHLENVPPQNRGYSLPDCFMQMFATTLQDVGIFLRLPETLYPQYPTVRYAKRHGYDFRCDVLPAKEMLDAIAPRDAHTWYKAGRNTDDAVDAVCHGCMDAYD